MIQHYQLTGNCPWLSTIFQEYSRKWGSPCIQVSCHVPPLFLYLALPSSWVALPFVGTLHVPIQVAFWSTPYFLLRKIPLPLFSVSGCRMMTLNVCVWVRLVFLVVFLLSLPLNDRTGGSCQILSMLKLFVVFDFICLFVVHNKKESLMCLPRNKHSSVCFLVGQHVSNLCLIVVCKHTCLTLGHMLLALLHTEYVHTFPTRV